MRIPTITKREHIAELTWRAQQIGGEHAAVLPRAAMQGSIRLAQIEPGGRIPLRVLEPDRRPLVLQLGDDSAQPTGPDGFPQARRFMRWARAIILHGAGADPQHYRDAVTAAVIAGNLLLVETTTGHLPAWFALRNAVAAQTPTLVIQTQPGAPAHPIRTALAGAVIQ